MVFWSHLQIRSRASAAAACWPLAAHEDPPGDVLHV